jgi:nucleotide-binding universal stress UspA family protein
LIAFRGEALTEHYTPGVPAFEIGKDGLSVVLVGMDGGGPADNAAAWAAGLARRERARLVLVYVEPIASASYWTPVMAASAVDAALAFVAELRCNARELLDPQGIRWDVVHHRGDVAHGLEAVAEERMADCIVVGRSRRGGSVARTLINLATRPVVVIP